MNAQLKNTLLEWALDWRRLKKHKRIRLLGPDNIRFKIAILEERLKHSQKCPVKKS